MTIVTFDNGVILEMPETTSSKRQSRLVSKFCKQFKTRVIRKVKQ